MVSAAHPRSVAASSGPTHRSNTTPHEHVTVSRGCLGRIAGQWTSGDDRRRTLQRRRGGSRDHETGSSVSITHQPSLLISCSTLSRWRRFNCRRSTPENIRSGVRRSPSRRSRTTLTSRQSSKCRRSSSYRSIRVRATTKMSTSTLSQADRSRSPVPLPADQSLDDFVRPDEYRLRDRHAECSSRLEVDDELERRRNPGRTRRSRRRTLASASDHVEARPTPRKCSTEAYQASLHTADRLHDLLPRDHGQTIGVWSLVVQMLQQFVDPGDLAGGDTRWIRGRDPSLLVVPLLSKNSISDVLATLRDGLEEWRMRAPPSVPPGIVSGQINYTGSMSGGRSPRCSASTRRRHDDHTGCACNRSRSRPTRRARAYAAWHAAHRRFPADGGSQRGSAPSPPAVLLCRISKCSGDFATWIRGRPDHRVRDAMGRRTAGSTSFACRGLSSSQG